MTQPDVQIRYRPAPPPPPQPIKRASRIALVVVWFLILLLPAFFFILATQGEILVRTGDLPEQYTRIWLISEARLRGIGISSASSATNSDTTTCVQTTVNYLLWMGSSDPSLFCECYTRSSPAESWSYSGGNEGTCNLD
jgi:hypothetical protein